MEISAIDRERLVGLVREVSVAEKIYLLGRTTMRRETESVFAAQMPECRYVTHHYLLVLAHDAKEMHAVQERIEAKCKPVMAVTAMVIRSGEFGSWMKAGHPFARQVAERALLLYDGTGETFGTGMVANVVAECKESRALFNTAMEKVEAFVAGADLYRLRKECGMAMFMLHQATECLLRTALHLMTGYYCHTHSIDKLVRYAGLVLWGLPEIFERWQVQKEVLFQLLQGAYVGGRYRMEYKVTGEELEVLYGCVMRLRAHVREVWGKRVSETL